MRATVVYSGARILLFAAATGLVYLAGASGLLMVALGLVISGLASYVLLARQRDAMIASFRAFRSRIDAGMRAEDDD
jgi:NADH:ubiquinone oxidoreductase subunit 2 (subunit N)